MWKSIEQFCILMKNTTDQLTKGVRVNLGTYGMWKLVTYVTIEFHRNVYSKHWIFPYILIEKLAHVSGTYS